jgi:hypothetical protein
MNEYKRTLKTLLWLYIITLVGVIIGVITFIDFILKLQIGGL